ncbi:hypothetical protein BKA01_002066 [Pseudonocardia eucalypti]|nr:hypothetical protein [Pseudonocardia eucalypti]
MGIAVRDTEVIDGVDIERDALLDQPKEGPQCLR